MTCPDCDWRVDAALEIFQQSLAAMQAQHAIEIKRYAAEIARRQQDIVAMDEHIRKYLPG